MRRKSLLLVAAASLFGAVGLKGQGLTSKVSVATSLKPRPHVTITNNYSSPLSGLVVIMSTAAAPQKAVETVWYDSGLSFTHNPPLGSGQSYSFPVGPADQAPNLQPHLLAVGFQDGESFGDRHWLSELHARRVSADEEIRAVTALLNQALAQRESEAEVLSALKTTRGSLAASVPDVWPRMAAEFVIDWTTANLERAGLVGDIGDPRKTIPLVILPWFSRWHAALRRSDPSIK